MKRYPRLVACPFTGVLKKVHSQEEERRFVQAPGYVFAVVGILFALAWLIF